MNREQFDPHRLEYLFLNLILAGVPPLLALVFHGLVLPAGLPALFAIGLPALVFLVLDGLLTGYFWWFNERYVTGVRVFRLPVEEILFFFTVPFASLFLWVNFSGLVRTAPGKLCWIHLLVPALFLLTAVLFLIVKRYYTFLVCLFWSLSLFTDATLGTNLFCRPSFQWFLLILTGLILAVKGFLTARPVILYNTAVKTNLNIWAVPIEDLLFGFSLVLLVFILYERIAHAF